MKRSLLVLFMIAGILAVRCAHSATVKIALRSETQVQAAKLVALRDIATITAPKNISEKLGGITITNSPMPGAKKTVSSSFVKSKVNASKLADVVQMTGSDGATLFCKSIRWTSQELTEQAKSLLESLLPQDNLEYEIAVTKEPRELVTVDDASVELKPRILNSTAHIGYNNVAMDVIINGRTAATTNITFKVKAVAEVLVAMSPIKQGEALTSQNTTWDRRDITRAGSAITMPVNGEVMQWVARKSINAGSTIGSSDVTLPPVIRKGDTITLLVSYGNVKLSTSAEAKSDGRVGESIRIKSAVSQKELQARVVEPGLVEIR